MNLREVMRVAGASAGAATGTVALYLTLEEFLRREHVIGTRILGFQNAVLLAIVWVAVAATRAWREWAE